MKRILLMLITLLSLNSFGQFAEAPENTDLGKYQSEQEKVAFDRPFRDSAFLDKTAVKAGETFKVLFEAVMDKDWYVYWQQSGGDYNPIIFKFEGKKLELVNVQYPSPKVKHSAQLGNSYVNYGKIPYILTFKVKEDTAAGKLDSKFAISWQACEKKEGGNCIVPFVGDPVVKFSINVGDASAANQAVVDQIAGYKKSFPDSKLPEGWKIHAFKSEQEVIDSTDEDKTRVKAKGYIITLSAPKELNDENVSFYPSTEDLHRQNFTHGWKGKGGYVQRFFPIDPDAEESSPTVKGVVIAKLDGKEYKFAVDFKPSDKEFVSDNNIESSSPFRTLDGKEAGGTGGLFYNILLALLGGLILNLMPCVFPVLSIKVMGFVNQAQEGHGSAMSHALVFTSGVVVSFWILAGTILGIRAASSSKINWGDQLQNPYIVLVIIAVLLAMALNLFGLFEMGTSLQSAGSGSQHKGKMGSFMSGVLATVVATPCMAPMLGAALTYAFTQPAYLAMIIFTSIALGMSSPYIILASFPGLLKFVPKPGAWMETFKKSMGFLMLLAVMWLLETLVGLLTMEKVVIILFYFVFLSAGLWIYGMYSPVYIEKPKRVKGIIAAALIVGLSLGLSFAKIGEKEVMQWTKFSPQAVKDAKAKGQPIFIDFTAKWCATCQVNKKLAIYPNAALFKKKGVLMLKADKTKEDPIINEWLEKYKSVGVPMNLLYDPKHDKPIKFPEAFTKGTVAEQLNKLEDAK